MDRIKTITVKELIAKRFPEQTWLVEKLFPEGGITIIAGYAGSGKTFLILELLICLSSGKDFLNKFKTNPNKALLIDEESGERRIQSRIKKMTKNYNLNFEIMSYQNFKYKDSEEVIKYCIEKNIKTIIIDSLVRIHNSEENSSTEMAKIFEKLKQFKIRDITTIIIHHNRKSGKNGYNPTEDMRGSSEILSFVDSGYSIKFNKKNKIITITNIKQRDAEEISPFTVDMEEKEDKLTFNFREFIKNDEFIPKTEKAKDEIIKILDANKEAMYQKEIIESLKNIAGESSIKSALKEMVNDEIIISKKGKGNSQYYKLKELGEKNIY